MSELDPFFKFKVGDLLRHKGCGLYSKGSMYRNGEPAPLWVVQRILEEDGDRIRAHYQCRVLNVLNGDYGSVLNFHEPELEKYESDSTKEAKP